MKRMMIHIRFVRVRGCDLVLAPPACLPESRRMFLADWIHSQVSDQGGMFNGNKIALKSLLTR